MITRNEKSVPVDDGGKAEVSDFEKTEVKKILDGIVGEVTGEKKDAAKTVVAMGEKKTVKAPATMSERKVPAKAAGTIGEVGAPAVKKAPAKKPTGKRMDFAKRSATKKVSTKPVVKKVAMKPAVAKAPAEMKKPAKKVVPKKEVAENELVEKPVEKKVEKPAEKPVVLKKPGHKIAEKASEQPPLVSVIIPVHNGARYIDSAIHSVLGQTFLDFELIIVDDASEDQTLRVVREFSSDKIRVIALGHKSGMAEARNAGVEKASGRYICFLNARDMWQPEKLEMQIEFMQENDSAFSYTGYVFMDENGIPSGRSVRVPEAISGSSVAKIPAIWVSTVMFDLARLTKNDIIMPAVKNAKKATWQKVLKKVGAAHGLNEVLAIRAYDHNMPLWKKVWRRV